MDGTEGSSSQSVNDKVKLISKEIKIPVFFCGKDFQQSERLIYPKM